ncbi:hypothetical protein CRYUN_Cryun15aG0081700 [Craigia yunnanensis]
MDHSTAGEGPAILQLHKWGPSELPLNLSEYREAFISPTRELLLSLSYQCQALLLPLITGDSVDADVLESCYDEGPQNSDLLACRSNSKDDIPCTSGSAMDSDNGISLKRRFSRSNSYPFLCDVNSLAWGVFGDAYNQHRDGSFRELFVTGNQDKSSANGNRGVPDNISKKAGDDNLSGIATSKRWLRSFFTKAETVEYEGSIWTRFPEKSSFPCSAKVVSFGIFTELDTDVGADTSYKCTRVFSSNSHQLIGFFLTVMKPASANPRDESEKKTKNIILVARLNSWGIQWVSLVKLEESVNSCPLVEWKDFHFSDDLLICLNASGLVFFYDAVSGVYVAHLDILQTCGLNCLVNLPEPESSTLDDDMRSKSNYQHGNLFGSRTFRRLLVASYTSLVAVIDEYGVVSSKTNGIDSFCDNIGSNLLQKIHGWNLDGNGCLCDSVLNGFSTASKVMDEKVHDSQIHFHLMRKGCFYMVTDGGVSVVLPSVSLSSNFLPDETIGYQQPSISTGVGCQPKNTLGLEESKMFWSPWKVEILDRVLLYEGPEDADRLCLGNGWDLKFSRLRRLQVALDYLKFDEVKQSLEILVGVNLAEEGVLRLLFAVVYLMFRKKGSDNEVFAPSRLLKLLTWFATKMIREYGLLLHRRDALMLQDLDGPFVLALPPVLPDKTQNEMGNSTRLHEMAHFLGDYS